MWIRILIRIQERPWFLLLCDFFMTFYLWLLIFCWHLDKKSRIRIRIRNSVVRIRGSGPGSGSKCHGSTHCSLYTYGLSFLAPGNTWKCLGFFCNSKNQNYSCLFVVSGFKVIFFEPNAPIMDIKYVSKSENSLAVSSYVDYIPKWFHTKNPHQIILN